MTETTTDQLLPSFPIARTCPFRPPATYAAIRADHPISKFVVASGRTGWLVTRHEHVRQLLADPRVSSDPMNPGFPSLVAGQQAVDRKGVLPWMDPPEHSTYRRMIVNEFTVRRIREMRPYLERIVNECIDDMENTGSPADLVQALALPVASLVICELLGVPYADRDTFQKRARTVVSRTATAEEWAGNLADMRIYLGQLVADMGGGSSDNLLSRLVTRFQEADITDLDHLSGLAMLLLIAGFETTANMIALGTVVLLEHPDELAQLTSDSTLLPNAVEELLRFVSHADHVTNRTATSDIEIGGVLIKQGDGILLSTAAGNHDEASFPAPEDLDLDRDTRHHLAFGHGIHQCIGQNLARLELEVVFGTLFRRLPRLALATSADDLPFRRETLIYGYDAVPVTW